MPSPILIDESVFEESFIPETLVSREGHVREIARCLAPAKSGKSIRNLLIYGPPGAGKTVLCKKLLEEHFAKTSVYVNCWEKRTAHKVWEEIISQSGGFLHGKESTSDLVKYFEKSRKRIIVCLDESDHLKSTDILYTLARNSCGIVLISNNPFILSKLDPRVKSGLLLNEIEFKPYDKNDVHQILKERTRMGIRSGSLDADLLKMVATMSSGDARVGLQIVKIAAKDAESKDLDMITIEEIKAASKCARKYRLSYLLSQMTDDQKVIYGLLRKDGIIESGKLYQSYRNSVEKPIVDRAFRKQMKRLEEMGLVRSSGSNRWRKYASI